MKSEARYLFVKMWKDDVIELLRYLPEAREGGTANKGKTKISVVVMILSLDVYLESFIAKIVKTICHANMALSTGREPNIWGGDGWMIED